MDAPESDWSRRYAASAKPPRAILWVGRHRRAVRVVVGLIFIGCAWTSVSIIAGGGNLVTPLLSVVTWAGLGWLYGIEYPRAADRWHAEHPENAAGPESPPSE